MKLAKNTRLVMIGDSITDCGRNHPIGESRKNGLGRGYVTYVNAFLAATYPEYDIYIQNTGISGNTIRDLKARWQTDCLKLKPEAVSIMIGINDVWRKFKNPYDKTASVAIKEYTETFEDLISQTKPHLSGPLILMTPFYIEPNKEEPMRKEMDIYSACVKQLAQKHNTLFVDVQAAFDKALQYTYAGKIADDRVHPNNDEGHAIIGNAFLRTIGALT